MDEDLRRSLEERNHYINSLRGAEMHWFFVQAVQAIDQDLYLPGVVALINGIETSLRVTMKQLQGQELMQDIDLGPTLSNSLLCRANESGLPVSILAFPQEADFKSKLQKKQPYAEVVRVRHDLCHGNVLEFLNDDLGEDNVFFTPESLRNLSAILRNLCYEWAKELGVFRRTELGL